METDSLWEGTAPEISFQGLSSDIRADVVIVGGGITGITAAQLLSEAGKRVVVLEARTVGGGTTGYSTGNLHTTLDDGLRTVRGKWGREVAAAVAASRSATIEHIEMTVAKYALTCRYSRRPHFIFPLNRKQVGQMKEEHDALAEAGLSVMLVDEVPLPASIGARQALRVNNQAQFQPMAYTRLLASTIESETCRVFEWSPAIDIDSDNGLVRCTSGSVRADHILLATHTPKGFNLLQTDLGPYREYGVAATLVDEFYPDGIFWSLEEPGHSIRSFELDGVRHLIVIGEKHKTGQHDDATRYYANVESYMRRHFNVSEIAYRWSAQHYRAADGLPYVGKTLNSGRAYVATGYGTNGLLYGPLAARIIVDEILGRPNPFAAFYAAKRFTPVKSAAEFLKENTNIAQQYARDWLTDQAATRIDALEELTPGEGRLVDVDGKKVAVYVDENGQVVTLSPVCTHLQCIVHWNEAERSWDCPCHGSRFACTGEVLEGPALAPLKRLERREPT